MNFPHSTTGRAAFYYPIFPRVITYDEEGPSITKNMVLELSPLRLRSGSDCKTSRGSPKGRLAVEWNNLPVPNVLEPEKHSSCVSLVLTVDRLLVEGVAAQRN